MRLTLYFNDGFVEYEDWDDPIPRKGERIISHNYEKENEEVYLIADVEHDFSRDDEGWEYTGTTLYLKKLALSLADIVNDTKYKDNKTGQE